MGESIELLRAQSHVWNHTFKYINSMSLKCVVELGIPDIIHSHGQPMSLSNLVAALHIQPSKVQCLSRLMRLLVHSGFFTQTHGENEQEKYDLTPSSRLLLRCNTEFENIPFVFLILNRAMTAPLETMSSWLCSVDEHSNSAFEMANGKSIWDYIAQEHDFGILFHKTMMHDSQLIGKVVTQECREVFEGLKSLVDVGGSIGFMAKAIAEAFPHITCTVFDLPQVVANSQRTIKNLSFIGGDMFEAIPPANAVLLKWILHDWNDEKKHSNIEEL